MKGKWAAQEKMNQRRTSREAHFGMSMHWILLRLDQAYHNPIIFKAQSNPQNGIFPILTSSKMNPSLHIIRKAM